MALESNLPREIRKASQSKIEIKWISVKEKLPHDYWRELYDQLEKEKGIYWSEDNTIDDFLVVVEMVDNNPNEKAKITIADYTKYEGWMYKLDNKAKYDGSHGWIVTYWAHLPAPPHPCSIVTGKTMIVNSN